MDLNGSFYRTQDLTLENQAQPFVQWYSCSMSRGKEERGTFGVPAEPAELVRSGHSTGQDLGQHALHPTK